MYEVYKNAWNLGGKLNKNIVRYFVTDENEDLFVTDLIKRNSLHRGIMPDITLRVGVIVSLLV